MSKGLKIFEYFSHVFNAGLNRKARRESAVLGVEHNNLSILEHVQQLRKHLMLAAIWLVLFTMICFAFMNPILSYLKKPYDMFLNTVSQNEISQNLTSISIFEVMTVNFKICFFLGFALSLPLVIYELWKFVAPALYQKEKKIAQIVLLASVFLFYAGILFGYYLIIPYFFQSALSWASQY
ncbi:MAG: twin-arginine translocase subunit TatC, partial [Bdellovibrionota bacterium]